MVTELNIEDYVKEYAGSGGSVVPELPDKSSLTLGNTVMFADQEWIVSHVTDTEAYLTRKSLLGQSTWDDLQYTCTTFANSLTEAQKTCLKSVTAGNTSGKVFVATKDQMNGGFSHFNSNSRRNVHEVYWTSTERSSNTAWFVNSGGDFNYNDFYKSDLCGFRPSICIDLTLYT